MKKREIILFISCCVISIFTNCTNDKADVIYPAPSSCDTTLVSHSKDLTPIMAHNCFDCHSGANASGGYNLEDTTTLQNAVLDGTLISAIKQDGILASPMPVEKPKLTSCEINKFIAWGNQGAKGNN
jgi:hypothetical protein